MKPRPVHAGWIAVGLLLAALTAFAVAYPGVTTTFDVSAETEWVEFVPGPRPRADWFLEDARLMIGDDSVGSLVSGALNLADSVRVVLERRSLGPLRLMLTPTGPDPRIGVLTLANSEEVPLSGYAEILIPDLEARAQRGKPVLFAAKGSLVTGRTIEIESGPSAARLRAGKITRFGKSIFGWAVFPAGSVDLAPGDQVTILAPQSTSYGLIAADEQPALTVGYRAVANAVEVRRPGGSRYTVGTTIHARMSADPILQAWWLALTVMILGGAWTYKHIIKREDPEEETA